jgi:hypothetical protein
MFKKNSAIGPSKEVEKEIISKFGPTKKKSLFGKKNSLKDKLKAIGGMKRK